MADDKQKIFNDQMHKKMVKLNFKDWTVKIKSIVIHFIIKKKYADLA
jgi:hypothetical protein